MRSQRGLLSDDRAAAFLVLDREFPRSVFFALTEAERRLSALSPPEAERIGVSDEARRQLGRIRTSLEFRATVRRHRRPARADAAGAGAPSWPPRTPSPSATSSPAPCRRGPRTGCSDAPLPDRPHTSLPYDGRVRAAHNELRMTPINEPGQTTLENRIRIRPMTWSHVYRRPLGHPRHGDGEPVRARAARHRGHLAPSSAPRSSTTSRRSTGRRCADPAVQDRSYEWLMLSPRTRPGAGIADLAEAVRGLPTPRAAAEELCGLVRGEMQLRARHHRRAQPRRGRLGRAGRRLPGLRPHHRRGAAQPRGPGPLRARATSCPSATSRWGRRARVRATPGSSSGTTGGSPATPPTAPTVGSDHIVVARGRDYEDVPPFKGIYSGRATASLEVSVAITRLA